MKHLRWILLAALATLAHPAGAQNYISENQFANADFAGIVRVVDADPSGNACTLESPPVVRAYHSGATYTVYTCQSSLWTAVTVGTGDVTAVFDCASGDCASITLTDGDLLDMSSVSVSSATEGLILPQHATDCSSAGTAEGQVCWEADSNQLYVGTAGGVTLIGAGSVSLAFKTFTPTNGGSVVADSATDTITFTDGAGITITGTALSDDITIASTLGTTIVSGEITDGTIVNIDMGNDGLDADKIVGDSTDDDDLDVAAGGTGVSTLTDGGILIGAGAGDITALGVATNGQIPIGDGTTAPVLGTITGTALEITVTNTAGAITLDIPTSPTLDATNITGLPLAGLDNDARASISAAQGSSLDATTVAFVDGGSGLDIDLTWEQTGTGDVRILYSDGVTTKDCTGPICSVELVEGSAVSPQINYVYVLKSTGNLTVDTTSFPTAEHHRIATVLVQDVTGALADGPYKVHAWSDNLGGGGSITMGHIGDLGYWIRNQPATYLSGVVPAYTITDLTPDTLDFAVTSGSVLQLHKHTFPARTSVADANTFWVINHNTPYTQVKAGAGLETLLADSQNVALTNKYYSLVFWGVVNESQADSKIMVNLPDCSYNTANGVIDDASGCAVYDIPSEYTGTGFLISEWKLHNVTNSVFTEAGTTAQSQIDLRGQQAPTNPSGSFGGSGSQFIDNAFKIIDETTATNTLTFQLAATGGDIVLTPPTASGTIAVTSEATGKVNSAAILDDTVSQADISNSTQLDTTTTDWDADTTWFGLTAAGGTGGVIFEGDTGGAGQDFETILIARDPTGDNTIQLPDASGNLAFVAAVDGSIADADVPNTITIDLATVATTANAGDSATAFFSSGIQEVSYGGTGRATFAIGDLLVGNGTTAVTQLADVAVGQLLSSGGALTAPAWSAAPAFTGTNITGTGTAFNIGGNAATATTAGIGSTVTIVDNAGTDEENYLVFTPGAAASGNLALESDVPARYNPSSGTISATQFVGGGGGLTGVTSSLWTDSTTNTYLTTTTDELIIGGTAAISLAKLSIDGDAAQPQFIVQAFSTQDTGSEEIVAIENSAGSNWFTVKSTGVAGVGRIGINTASPGAELHVEGTLLVNATSTNAVDIRGDSSQVFTMTKTGAAHFNINSVAVDFVVESATDAAAFWVDGDGDCVNISGGACTGASALDVGGAVTATSFTAAASATPSVILNDSEDATGATDMTIVGNCPYLGDCDLAFKTLVATSDTEAFRIDTSDGGFQKTHFTSVISMGEMADAPADDIAGWGMLWVDTVTPNVLMFTDDTGADFAITKQVKSMYWGAGAMEVDGTGCTAPTAVALVTNGPTPLTIACGDSDTATISGSTVMPDGWDAGTVTFEVSLGQISAGTTVFDMDFEGQCIGTTENYLAFAGTGEQQATVTLVADDDAFQASTTAVTLNSTGGCAAGDILVWRGAIDGTGDNTSVGTEVVIVGVKMEYSSNIGD